VSTFNKVNVRYFNWRADYLSFRQIFDRSVAVMAIVLLSPLLIVTAVLVAADGGSVFFRQARLGKDASRFSVIKFRTMIENADAYLDASGQPTRERVTRIGRILRNTSIDELPQLFNIIKGDMALIGPRPILPQMLPYMTKSECERFAVRPGITGLAQVKGRNYLRWSRRFKYDIVYARRASPSLDLYILFRTAAVVLFAQDIAPDINKKMVDDVTVRPLNTEPDV
jgi:lipopolysaccharide/colanic/teichoic acid biosynthesis glycosyltransferase